MMTQQTDNKSIAQFLLILVVLQLRKIILEMTKLPTLKAKLYNSSNWTQNLVLPLEVLK